MDNPKGKSVKLKKCISSHDFKIGFNPKENNTNKDSQDYLGGFIILEGLFIKSYQTIIF